MVQSKSKLSCTTCTCSKPVSCVQYKRCQMTGPRVPVYGSVWMQYGYTVSLLIIKSTKHPYPSWYWFKNNTKSTKSCYYYDIWTNGSKTNNGFLQDADKRMIRRFQRARFQHVESLYPAGRSFLPWLCAREQGKVMWQVHVTDRK